MVSLQKYDPAVDDKQDSCSALFSVQDLSPQYELLSNEVSLPKPAFWEAFGAFYGVFLHTFFMWKCNESAGFFFF